jgi:hypothetical protein
MPSTINCIALLPPKTPNTYLIGTNVLAFKPLASSRRHPPPEIAILAGYRLWHSPRLSILPSAAVAPVLVADYVPKFPRLFDTPVKDFIAPDVPPLSGFNADTMTKIFVPDLINPSNVYTFLLFISCAAAVVYLELGALFNDFVQERDFEKLEEHFLEGQREDRRKSKIEMRNTHEELSPEEVAYKERKRGLGWLAFITAAAIWCTGILNKFNAFQP